jgi:hypothetical protein
MYFVKIVNIYMYVNLIHNIDLTININIITWLFKLYQSYIMIILSLIFLRISLYVNNLFFFFIYKLF